MTTRGRVVVGLYTFDGQHPQRPVGPEQRDVTPPGLRVQAGASTGIALLAQGTLGDRGLAGHAVGPWRQPPALNSQQQLRRGAQRLLDRRFQRHADGFAEHIVDRTADEIATQRRDDAEGTAMIAAFRYFQVGIVFRREPDSLWRNQVDKWVVFSR